MEEQEHGRVDHRFPDQPVDDHLLPQHRRIPAVPDRVQGQQEVRVDQGGRRLRDPLRIHPVPAVGDHLPGRRDPQRRHLGRDLAEGGRELHRLDQEGRGPQRRLGLDRQPVREEPGLRVRD